MNFAGILAGGSGTRMGKTDLPKQFLMLGDKPIIIHTIEQFLASPLIEKVIVAVPKVWITHTRDIIDKYCKLNTDNIEVIEGGKDRNETVMNVFNYIDKNYDSNKDTVIVTHDAVRPFITQRIIKDNIEECLKYGATDTVVPAFDTIVESKDGKTISNIPVRSEMYQGQTPQSFKLKEFIKINNSLTPEEKSILTDACKVYTIKNKKVGLVMGESFNIKITTKHDLKMANLMIGNLKEDIEC